MVALKPKNSSISYGGGDVIGRKCYTLSDIKEKYNLTDRPADKIKAWAKEHNFAEGPYFKPDFIPILEEAVQMKKEIGFHGRWLVLLDMAYKNLYGDCGCSSISGLIEYKEMQVRQLSSQIESLKAEISYLKGVQL